MASPNLRETEPALLKKGPATYTLPFLFLLAGLAVLAGWLLSKINLVGRAGIAVFYNEYRFFTFWWKGTLAVYSAWLLLFFMNRLLMRKLVRAQARLLHVAALVIPVIGLYFTYTNFRTDVSHRIIGERFHLGFYLFWMGWMLIALFYLFLQKDEVA